MQNKIYIFVGVLIGFALSISSFLYAQTQIQTLKPENIYLTKADYKYSTSTLKSILSTENFEILKEEYNNTERIIEQLKLINLRLYKIEQNTK